MELLAITCMRPRKLPGGQAEQEQGPPLTEPSTKIERDSCLFDILCFLSAFLTFFVLFLKKIDQKMYDLRCPHGG
jgi:hypothetical protein